jgi:hypothetical protein
MSTAEQLTIREMRQAQRRRIRPGDRTLALHERALALAAAVLSHDPAAPRMAMELQDEFAPTNKRR